MAGSLRFLGGRLGWGGAGETGLAGVWSGLGAVGGSSRVECGGGEQRSAEESSQLHLLPHLRGTPPR